MKDLATALENLFWYWIAERHAIYLKRSIGQPKPWTEDSILRDYKFTNPFRENDRGTVWLREHFIWPHRDGPKDLLAFNICWYRMFNWTGTGEHLGWRTSWPLDEIRETLNRALAAGEQVFTGAHIVYSPPGMTKIDAITKVCQMLWQFRLAVVQTAEQDHSLQKVFDVLRLVHCVGGFMAYEMVSDLRHTPILEDAVDIMTWANPGPGAQRGLRRLSLPSKPDPKAIESMCGLLARSREGLPSFVPPLEMRDIEHSLCEFDKYCRVKFGEGEPRSKFNGAA